MLILGIETSCDETAAAVLRFGQHRELRNSFPQAEILSNIIRSQIDEHSPYGGVVPEIASRVHVELVEIVIDEAIRKAGIAMADIDGIAVTHCPGLIGGLLVGVVAAKTLAYVLNKPLIGVNHLEGHSLSAYISGAKIDNDLLLLVSGGHCQIINIKAYDDYHILGQTLDDALGEAFDKVAKMLGLPYPGGAYVERLAKDGDAFAYDFPRPLYGRAGCDFSFSGLKTAVRREIAGNYRAEDICASFQRVAGEIIADRLDNALKEVGQGTNLIIAGGVAANQYLRGIMQIVADKYGRKLLAPPLNLCTDNAAMIAYAGGLAMMNEKQSDYHLEPIARVG